jgi:RNA polymerase sigma-70 factor, ECF subfamily
MKLSPAQFVSTSLAGPMAFPAGLEAPTPDPHTASPSADAALVTRMTQGDRGALGELYSRHAQTLLALAHRVLRDRHDAEEVVHDVFLEAWRHATDYSEARGSVRTWLLLRTRCRALDRVRSSVRKHEVATTVASDGAHKGLERSELLSNEQHRLPAALAQMSETQQRVIQLAYFEGLSTPEISLLLGIPAGTVKSRIHAALKTLRSVLGIADE